MSCPSLGAALADASCPSAEVARAYAYCPSAEIDNANTASSPHNKTGVAGNIPCPSLGVARADPLYVSPKVCVLIMNLVLVELFLVLAWTYSCNASCPCVEVGAAFAYYLSAEIGADTAASTCS